MSKLPVGTIALTNPEAKLIMIALRARCARLQNKLLHVEDTAKAQVEADRTRTSVLLAKVDKAFPESNFHHARPTAPSATLVTHYQKALCDYADEMAQHIFDPNS